MSNFYVYVYCDPRTPGIFSYDNLVLEYEPFYVGKGHEERAYIHLAEAKGKRRVKNNPKHQKIKKILKEGLEPDIKIIKYFEDEQEAYDYEEYLIRTIGSNFTNEIKDGPLTNVCVKACPPNHKGKTYEEIYGSEKAKEQIEKRSAKQKAMGGYGPKKHSEETRKRLSELTKGENNPNYGKTHSEKTRSLISKAKKGKPNPNKGLPIEKLAFEYTIQNPEGEIIIIKENLENWCRKMDLPFSVIRDSYKRGKGPSRGRAVGWKIIKVFGKYPKTEEQLKKLKMPKSEEHKRKIQLANSNKYKLINPNGTEEIFECKTDLLAKYNFSQNKINKLIETGILIKLDKVKA